MNYYEELGVRQDASTEDIRQAYKMMARLLHPDRQVDPNLKPIADRQMKRLGEIVALLADPRTRSHYDEALSPGNHLQTPHRRRARLRPASVEQWNGGSRLAGFAVRYWFWILIGVCLVALSAWTLLQPSPAVPVGELREEAFERDALTEHQPVRRPPKPRSTPGIVPNVPNRPAAHIPAGEESWTPVIAPPEGRYGPEPENIPPVLIPSPEPLPELGRLLPQESLPPVRSEWSFAGMWLYSPKAGDGAEQGVYPAMYVELHLVERAGEMAGEYRALYRVHDQAISPEVIFQIRGAAQSPTSARVAWIARDHAKGQAEMTLQSPNVLYVSWWTTVFGRQAALGSGTAVLIRQQVP